MLSITGKGVYDFNPGRVLLTSHELGLNSNFGWLETAVISDVLQQEAIATLDNGENVLLKRYKGRKDEGINERILVKIGKIYLFNEQPIKKAYFISAEIPEYFTFIKQGRYMLYSLWDKNMEKSSKIPSFSEIKEYFDVEDEQAIGYLHDAKGKKIITPHETLNFNNGRKSLICSYASSLILCERKEDVKGLIEHCNEIKMRAIKMQSLFS